MEIKIKNKNREKKGDKAPLEKKMGGGRWAIARGQQRGKCPFVLWAA